MMNADIPADDAAAEPAATPDAALPDRARELQLQWRSIRAAARAARLEARAAEIELELQRMLGPAVAELQTDQPQANEPQAASQPPPGAPAPFAPSARPHPAATPAAEMRRATARGAGRGGMDSLEQPSDQIAPSPADAEQIWEAVSWESMLTAIRRNRPTTSEAPQAVSEAPQATAEAECTPAADRSGRFEETSEAAASPAARSRRTENVSPLATSARTAGDRPTSSPPPSDPAPAKPTPAKSAPSDPAPAKPHGSNGNRGPATQRHAPAPASEGAESRSPALATQQLAEHTATRRGEVDSRKRRPAAWLLSSLLHAAALIVLAMVTISIERPADQLTLAAAAPSVEDEPLQQVEIAQTAPTANRPVDSAVERLPQPQPELPAVRLPAPALDAPLAATPAGMLSGDLAARLGRSGGDDPSALATQFFGLSGGGNHFVYLVDNSGSMDSVAPDGFEVARLELLRAIDQLRDDQRFYVIFFGEETLRMRLSGSGPPESRSVFATAENKAALRRWAATIAMQPGRWPEEALEFAFSLRPDCIFLLTDGEMSQRVVPMIEQHNIVDTLLDGPKPRSIIHTVGFHSREGESQLRQIARTNGGRYRYVPPNGSGRR